MKTYKIIVISLIVSLTVFIIANSQTGLGAAITTITGTDTVKNALKVIVNDNFTSLNSGKMEKATTTLYEVTSATSITAIGILTTGTWNADVIDVARQGTGTTSPTFYRTMIGDGGYGFTVASTTGTSGQFWTSGGSGAYPNWTTSGVVLSDRYDWTGVHNFLGATYLTDLNASSTVVFNKVSYSWPSALGASSTVPKIDASGSITWNVDNREPLTVFITPGEGFTNGTLNSLTAEVAGIEFADGVTDKWEMNIKVPQGADTISLIQVGYARRAAGNLYLKFVTQQHDWVIGDARVLDNSDTNSTYAGGATNGTLGLITVPAGAYDGITVTADDFFSLQITRTGGDGNDTYNTTWEVLGVMITFE